MEDTDAPVNILVESPDPVKAKLVGEAIALGLKENFGFSQVVHANIVTDTPGFRAWTVSTKEETQESLLAAMVRHNPDIMKTPVTVMSREQESYPTMSSTLQCKPSQMVGGIGEQGQTFDELREMVAGLERPSYEAMREAAWQKAQAKLQPAVEKFAHDMAEMFEQGGVTITGVGKL